MKKEIIAFWLLIFLFGTAQTTAIPNNASVDSIEINTLVEAEDFIMSSEGWGLDGNYLLVRSYKPISMSESLNYHYLLDIENRTYGKIDYGITEEESNYIVLALPVGWNPSGDKIYFSISKGKGGNVVICNPDGTDVRVMGFSETTTLSEAISNLGGNVRYREVTFSPDSSKVVYVYDDPDNFLGNLWIEDADGTDAFELRAEASKPVWYNSTIICFLTGDGTLMFANKEGNPVQTISPHNENEKFTKFVLSPDKKKITIFSIIGNRYLTYIANVDGTNLQVAEIDKDSPIASDLSNWQPNGSSIVLEENGDLYVFEGREHTRRLLYEGNASQVQWFPDGKKLLFIEDENKIYSINVDGDNLFYITDIGLIPSHIWELFEKKTVSISSSGDLIAFTSRSSPEGKMIDTESSLSDEKDIAGPLFLVNSNGTNLTQITPAINGRYYFLDEWVSAKDLLIIDYVEFSDKEIVHGRPSLLSLNGEDLKNGWKEKSVGQIFYADQNSSGKHNQSSKKTLQNESISDDLSESENKSLPSFKCVDLLVIVFCIYLLKYRGI